MGWKGRGGKHNLDVSAYVIIRQQGRVRKAFRIPRLVAWPRISRLCWF